jgi:N6-adenosine-specific RNA methylase IME4
MFDNFFNAKYNIFTQSIIIRKGWLIFGNRPELAIQTSDDIRRKLALS